jgi:hypothetical protein
VAGAARQPGVYEIAGGTKVGGILSAGGAEAAANVLIGGFCGTWHEGLAVAGLPLTTAGLRDAAASPGARDTPGAARRELRGCVLTCCPSASAWTSGVPDHLQRRAARPGRARPTGRPGLRRPGSPAGPRPEPWHPGQDRDGGHAG